MGRLEVGDPNFVLVSCEDDFKYKRNERRTWFVFEKDVYQGCGHTLWMKNYEDVMTADYIRRSVRFRLKKTIRARQNGDVKTLRDRIVELARMAVLLAHV